MEYCSVYEWFSPGWDYIDSPMTGFQFPKDEIKSHPTFVIISEAISLRYIEYMELTPP